MKSAEILNGKESFDSEVEMTKTEAIKEIEEYIQDADNAIAEDDEYIRGWKSAFLVALEVIMKLD